MRARFFAVIFGLMVPAAFAQSSPKAAPEDLEFFESKIRPVLAKNCYFCHSRESKTSRGGLVVDTREGIRLGGESGHAVVPGDPEASVLLQAVRYDGTRKMPPMGKLPDSTIADFDKWIRMGAPDPREGAAPPPSSARVDFAKAREFWSFQPPKIAPAPAVKNKAWPRTPIDRFIAQKLEAKRLAPAADADRRTLLRRVSYDLTGLPPSPEEMDAFVQDKSKDAFAKVVDRMLASERFGERWGRHWLDVARYAETTGRTRNQPFPVAWRYRDWVIDAFNRDKPYDRFIVEQIAGDLLDGDATEKDSYRVATGFLALGAHDLNELDKRQYEMDVADEQINAVSKSFLAMTAGCARCHDHKFDPIPTKDYYALAGIFRSTELLNGLRRRPQFNQAFFTPELLAKLETKPAFEGQESAELEKKYGETWERLQAAEKGRNRPEVVGIAREWGSLPLPRNLALGVREASAAADCEVNLRGDPHSLGEKVPRGFLQILPTAGDPKIGSRESGRLQLARWIASRENPLTARVIVNRIWHHLLGRGIVDSPDNFGNSGSRPTHPELLDYLAVRFMDQGWSIKKVIREVVLSRTYQLSSEFNARNYEVEPDNRLLWRANRRRLEAEAVRDSLLMVSGQLKLQRPDASPINQWKRAGEPNRGGGRVEPWDLTETYRTVYVPVVRNIPSRFLETFDFPEPSETRGQRDITTVAPQALFLLNSEFVLEQARIASERLLAAIPDDAGRVVRAYRQVLGREPSAAESERALGYLRETAAASQAASDGIKQHETWTRLYQVLFTSAEFRYRS